MKHVLATFLIGFGVMTAVLHTQTARTHVTTGAALPANCVVGDIWIKTGTSAGPYWCSATDTWTASTGSSGAALDAITAATTQNHTIANANNYGQVWNWQQTTNATKAFEFGETAAATGGSSNTQQLVSITTLAGSTAVPLYIHCGSTSPQCFRVDDVAADTTPFIIDDRGFVGIGKAPNELLDMTTGAAGSAKALVSNASVTGGIWINFDATYAVGFGSTTNSAVALFANNARALGLRTTGTISIARTGSTTISNANMAMAFDAGSFTANEYRLIGMGYQSSQTHMPVAFGTQLVAATGNRGLWDLVFLTSNSNSDVVPLERLRIDNQGTLILRSTTPTPAVSNTSANSCGTSAATIAGNNNVGTVTVGAGSGTDCTITFTTTAPVEWICHVNNASAAQLARAVPTSTTTTKFQGTFAAGALLNYLCFPR